MSSYIIEDESVEDYVRRIRAESEIKPRSPWMPIDTAPKDGAEILAWVPSFHRGKGGRMFCIWFEGNWMPTDKHFRKVEPSLWCNGPMSPEEYHE